MTVSRVRLARILTALVAVGIWAWLALPSALGGPLGVVWVNGTSMEPALHDGDVAVVYRSAAYEVDDVIAFSVPEGGIVIHRVVEITGDTYVPRGDNRPTNDHWRPASSDISGRMVLRLPHAGDALLHLRRPTVLAAITTALVFGLSITRPRTPVTE